MPTYTEMDGLRRGFWGMTSRSSRDASLIHSQFMSMYPLVISAHIIFVDVLASTPYIRAYFSNANCRSIGGKAIPVGCIFLGLLLFLLSAASFGALLPWSLQLGRGSHNAGIELDNLLQNVKAASSDLGTLAEILQEEMAQMGQYHIHISLSGVMKTILCMRFQAHIRQIRKKSNKIYRQSTLLC